MSGQRSVYKKYEKQLEHMSEPVMPSQLPKRKMDLKKLAEYIQENHIDPKILTDAEKEKIIEEVMKEDF